MGNATKLSDSARVVWAPDFTFMIWSLIGSILTAFAWWLVVSTGNTVIPVGSLTQPE